MAFAPRLPARWLPCALAAVLALPAPAAAQWLAVGRWGTAQNFRHVPPGTWMVLESGASGIEITAEGENHVGRLSLWCRPDMPLGGLHFTQYIGPALRRTLRDPARIESEPVALVLGEQRFDLALDLIEWEQAWVAQDILEPGLLEAFRRANRLELQNGDGETITRFRMNGAIAALGALRRICRI